MTGGSPDNNDSDSSYLRSKSDLNSEKQSFFDPPIENYRKLYAKRSGVKGGTSTISGGTKSNDGISPNTTFQLRLNKPGRKSNSVLDRSPSA